MKLNGALCLDDRVLLENKALLRYQQSMLLANLEYIVFFAEMNTVIFKVVHFQCNYIISEFFHFAVRFRSVTLYKFDLESLSHAFLRTFQVEDKEL